MRKLFPPMYSQPKWPMLICIGVYWGLSFVLFPMYLPLLGMGIWETPEWISWLEIGYHGVNAIVMIVMLSECLKDGWFMLTLDWKGILKHVGLTVGLILLVLMQQITFLSAWDVPERASLEMLPIVEMYVSLTPGYFAIVRPVWATASMVLCSPFAICGLFYALGFAPLCVKEKPVLAYINVVLITALPALFDILWRHEVERVVITYLIYLPAHLIACWSYQKTDNVWTPILSLSAVNLICSLANILVING